MQTEIKETTIFDMKCQFLWPANDTSFNSTREDWIKDSRVWLEHCKRKKVVVQAGGCAGMYPCLYSQHFETVYTFEPSGESFYYLVNNCADKNIVKFNCALSDKNELLGLWDTNKDNIGTHFIDREDWVDKNDGFNNSYTTKKYIPSITIDQLSLTSCDLIHLDCEGSEEAALLGASKTLSKFYPTVITELGRGRSFLNSLGYEEVYKGEWDIVFKKI